MALRRRNVDTFRNSRTARLRDFASGVRWIVRPDGKAFGDSSGKRSHEQLSRAAGYRNADHAYSDGALRVRYDTVTSSVSVEIENGEKNSVRLAMQMGVASSCCPCQHSFQG